MKRNLIISLIVALVIVLLTATAIFAGSKRNVAKDTTCQPGAACSDGFGVYVQSSSGPGGGGCVDAWIGYIGWDLTSETRTWQSASLKLTQYNVVGGTPPFTLKLYPANNDTWTVDGGDPGYDNTSELASVQYNGTDATVELASDALGTYFLNKKGGPASVAVVMTDGCGDVSGTVQFEDMEGSGGSAPQSGNEADLVFWTGPVVSGTPTTVEMSTFSADNTQPVNYALYAGLAALAVLALGAVGYGYSRTR
jgi:hypothetical protein